MHEPTSPSPASDPVGSAVTAALAGVIDPCCRDRGISVVDMGLVSEVHVDPDGHAAIDILLTSGWCPFQVDLTAEVTAAAETVPGVRTAEVRIRVDRTWSPDRMSPSARQRLRLLPEPSEVGDRDRYLAANPLPIAHVG